MKPIKDLRTKAEQARDLEAEVSKFLAKGGTVTRCQPGPSETVAYKHSFRGRPAAAKKPKAEPSSEAG
jgi:hypothetical protein